MATITKSQLEKCLSKCLCEIIELKINYDVKLDKSVSDYLMCHYMRRIDELEVLMEDIHCILNHINHRV